MNTTVFDKISKKLTETWYINPKIQSKTEIETCIVKSILGIPNDVADDSDIDALFGKNYIPGTFMISEAKKRSGFLPGEMSTGYDRWVRLEIRNEIEAIKGALVRGGGNLQLDDVSIEDIEEDIIEVLDYKLENGKKLCELVALQEYTDVFRRLILLLLLGNPEGEIDTYVKVNTIGRKIALLILMEQESWPLLELLKASIASGLIGLNLKRSASATSKIYQHGIIPIHLDISIDDQVKYITQRLEKKIKERMAISHWSEYKKEVLSKNREVSIAFFTDDYIETIFDLKLIEKQLNSNRNLVVYLIPRHLCCGNDACYSDIMNLLDEPAFKDLQCQYKGGRMQVCKNGPMLGTVNGLKISQDVANILKKCDCVVVKGARTYETLQGIRKVAYFAFAVSREISESVTGIDAETGRIVFIRQDAGERSFEGFRNRENRTCVSVTGRRYKLSTITAKDFCHKDHRIKKYFRESEHIASTAAKGFRVPKPLLPTADLCVYFLGLGGGDYIRRTPVGNSIVADMGGFGIFSKSSHILIDPGPDTIREMFRIGADPQDLDGVIITHRHVDHFADWEFVLARMARKAAPEFESHVPKKGTLLASRAFLKGWKEAPRVASPFYLQRLEEYHIMVPGRGQHRIGNTMVYPRTAFHKESKSIPLIPSVDIIADGFYIVYLSDGEYREQIVEERMSQTYFRSPDLLVINIQTLDVGADKVTGYTRNQLGWKGTVQVIKRLRPRMAIVRSWGLETITKVERGRLVAAPEKLALYKSALVKETETGVIIPGTTIVNVDKNKVTSYHVKPPLSNKQSL